MKEKLTLEQIFNDYELPDMIMIAGPVMIGLAVLEAYISYRQNRQLYEKKDFFASLSIGLGYIVQGVFIKSALFLLALWAYNIVPWAIKITWWSSILCFFWLDFLRYLSHRWSHEINFLWATHVTHHSSEKYNWSTSFRLSWTQQIKMLFFLPVSFAGFHPVVFFICHQICVIYQFWIHTELIRKLPAWVEFFFVTPSHHRCHHAVNDQYIDKNYGSTFIIWDRMFGTFVEEKEKAIYGIKHQIKSYNPVRLVFHVWVDIFRQLGKARSLKEATIILFAGPGKYDPRKFKK